MGDDPQHNPPSPDSADSGEVVSQEDLDTLLSEASELAAEIAGDVGADDLDPADVEAMNLGSAPSDDAENGEAESPIDTSSERVVKKLADLEGMLSQTQDELGVPTSTATELGGGSDGTRLPSAEAHGEELGTRLPPVEPKVEDEAHKPGPVLGDASQEDDLLDLAARASDAANTPKEEPSFSYASTDDLTSPPPAADPRSEHPPEASEPSVPDFMQEFTESADDEPTIPAARDKADNLPGLSEPEPSEPEDAESKPGPGPARAKQAAEPGSPRPRKVTARLGIPRGLARRVAALVASVSPIALRVADRGIDLLDVANRPVRWLGHGAREALGWLAIATLGTSLLVFLVSLF